jgi:hypothetical protein
MPQIVGELQVDPAIAKKLHADPRFVSLVKDLRDGIGGPRTQDRE